MAKKREAPKFTAFVKYTVEVEVPIRADNLETAVAAASALSLSDVYGNNHVVLDHDGPQVRGVFGT